jgi:desulfoferrodoxin (superoxide reductase-like protein)
LAQTSVVLNTIGAWENECEHSLNTVGNPEQHIPIAVIIPDSSDRKNNVGYHTVEVTVPHLMDTEKPHFIQGIWLKDDDTGMVAGGRLFKATDPSPPTLIVELKNGCKVTPMLYCNVHGLWKGESFTVA